MKPWSSDRLCLFAADFDGLGFFEVDQWIQENGSGSGRGAVMPRGIGTGVEDALPRFLFNPCDISQGDPWYSFCKQCPCENNSVDS
jgi:hypothetical protein